MYARMYNPGHIDVRVYKHTHMALFTPVAQVGPIINMEELHSLSEVDIDAYMSSVEIPEHLRPMFDEGCKYLDDEQKNKLKKFILENQGCFARLVYNGI